METTSVGQFVQEVALAIRARMSDQLRYPESLELQAVMDDFERAYEWKGIGGAIDCSHIKILAPYVEQKESYFDKNRNWTKILQAVADRKLRFLDVKIGWPRSSHDARVWSASQPFKDMLSGAHPLRHTGQVRLHNRRITPYLLRDSGYHQCEWLVTPYTDNQIAYAEGDQELCTQINKELSSMWMCGECSSAF